LTHEWPTGADVWLPGGAAPHPGALFRNPALAATWQRILREAGPHGSREARIDRARAVWSQGFVADAIDRFFHAEPLLDASGERHLGLLTGHDMAQWQATYEDSVSHQFMGWTVHKTGPWGQGPVLLQALAILDGVGLSGDDLETAEGIHVVLEAMKLAFGDREAYYGDPHFVDVPLAHLLSPEYNAQRRAMIGQDASQAVTPGIVPGFEQQVAAALAQVRPARPSAGGLGVGEPTMMHLQPTIKPRDTVHLDVADRWGNMVSATPSGGWPQSSPTIPGLGFAMNTRAQMFWLEPGLPGTLAPGKRPRTTLTPTLAECGDRRLVCGTPGGDQQDQWQLQLLLRHLVGGLGLQRSIDMPLYHSLHFPASFYPRQALLGAAVLEESFGPEIIADLRRRGHDVQVAPAWSAGRLTAVGRDADGILSGAATPRLMQAYAVGR
jgi:gamma-glutamyltranspeptidase/glutathione hydrolase